MNPNVDVVQVALFSPGRHTTPHAGGCLMELVAATAGGPWTDRPACTAPVLAHLARAVNDHTSPTARPALAALFPYLISEPGRLDHPKADVAVGTSVVTAASAGASPDLVTALKQQLQQAAADADLPQQRWLPRLTPLRHHHRLLAVADLALKAIYDTTDPRRLDTVLDALFVAAINAQRLLEDLPPISPPTGSPDPATLTVLTRMVMPPGADWHELEVRIDPDRCPTWLTDPWLQRQAELELLRW